MVVALAASAETAWSLRARFALDLEGLTALERAGVALWDFRPLATAVFAGGALAVLLAEDRAPSRLEPLRAAARSGLAVLAGAQAALALVVVGLAVWIAAAGEVGGRDQLGFAYSPAERTITLVTQVLAWLPLAAFLGGVAALASRPAADAPPAEEEPASAAEPVSEEMEALWREELAFGPRRERGRMLLRQLRAAEEAGDEESVRRLAEELRSLARA